MTKQLIPKGGNDDVQTPLEVALIIVSHFKPKGKILEPCRGNGNFLGALPVGTDWCEIKEGKDFFDYNNKVNWIITNPPYSQMRAFMNKSMEVSNNIVFLTSINHLWLKARMRDVKEKGFGIKEILLLDTPKSFPQSGFQFGCFHLQKGWKGDIKFSNE